MRLAFKLDWKGLMLFAEEWVSCLVPVAIKNKCVCLHVLNSRMDLRNVD
jgi:hypothetical protein